MVLISLYYSNQEGFSVILNGDLDFGFVKLCFTYGTLSFSHSRLVVELLVKLNVDVKYGLNPEEWKPGALETFANAVMNCGKYPQPFPLDTIDSSYNFI